MPRLQVVQLLGRQTNVRKTNPRRPCLRSSGVGVRVVNVSGVSAVSGVSVVGVGVDVSGRVIVAVVKKTVRLNVFVSQGGNSRGRIVKCRGVDRRSGLRRAKL